MVIDSNRKPFLFALTLLAVAALACSAQVTPEPPTDTPRPRSTATRATATALIPAPPTPTAAPPPTATPIPTQPPTPAPTFAPFPTRASADPNAISRAPCGSFTVVRQGDPQLQGDRVAILAPDGSTVREWKPAAPGENYTVDWCYDVTGDGSPELMIIEYSGGAHCCFTSDLFSLGDKPALVLRWEAGNGGGLKPVNLDGQFPLELQGFDARFAYYADLPYVATSQFPIVFAWREGRYVEATREFPQILQADRKAESSRIQECKGDDYCLRGIGVHLLAVSLMIGDWDQVKGNLGLPAATVRWLDEHRAEVAQTLGV